MAKSATVRKIAPEGKMDMQAAMEVYRKRMEITYTRKG
jgi:hypothetical protein